MAVGLQSTSPGIHTAPQQEFSSGGNPLSADTDNNGMSDALEYRYEMNLSTHVDSDTDGMPDDYETVFGLSPTDPSDASLDRDSDALSNLEEYQLGTRPDFFDSDGDLLGDEWEVNQGLNPLQANLLDGDSDQDGLDTYDEYLNGTNPNLGDSDSDGTPDGREVAQGSNPANANDNGQSPATDKLQEVNFTVGDPSGSHSERWEMTITGLGADTRVMRLSNRDFGTMTNPTPYKLWKDSNYEITIAHLGTKQTGNGPDYDWQAQVEGTPSNWVLTGGNKHTGTNRFSVIHNQWILDNEDGLLGIVDESFNNSNHASDKSAKLLKVEFETFPDDVSGPDKAHKINLSTRQNEAAFYGDFEKFVAYVYKEGNLNLIDYLEGAYEPSMRQIFEDNLKWRSNGTDVPHELNFVLEPQDNEIRFFKIEVLPKDGDQVLDRLIITVVPRSTKSAFDAWKSANRDTGWLAELPPLYSSLEAGQDPDESCNPRIWESVSDTDSYYHPAAQFAMRSEETQNGHGHQACYDGSRSLIRAGVSAGTADKAHTSNLTGSDSHKNQDVLPFIWALQLDGNPVEGDFLNLDLTQPIAHEGAFSSEYLSLRPPIANSAPELQPGTCP